MIDIKNLKSYSKKYIAKYADTINMLIKSLEEENKSVYDKDAKLIIEDFFKYNNKWMSLSNEYDEIATQNFQQFWQNMITDCGRFMQNDRLMSVIATTSKNPGFKKIAAKLQKNLTSVDDLADYTQNELCSMLKQHKIGIQGILTTIDMMYEYEVPLKDCPTRNDMLQFHQLLEIIASKGGENDA